MDYLALVNKAIEEAGIDLDPLTSGNFASPPNEKMYTRFKNWVADAWKELQMERDDWEFKVSRADVVIKPRIYVENGNRATSPPLNAEYTGQLSEYRFLVDTVNLLSGTWAGGDAKAFIDFDLVSGNYFDFNEAFDELAPTPATGIFTVKGFGRYDLKSEVTDLQEPLIQTFYIQDALGGNMQKLGYIDWPEFNRQFEADDLARGEPRWVTTSPDGLYDFYPRPDKDYVIYFQYTKEPTSLSLFSDTPSELESQYHESIAWRAIMYYSSYDRQPSVYSYAQQRYYFYKNRMEKRLMPVVTFGRNVYDE